jgi:DNA-binding NarL/FixJ family response regulator
MFFATGGTVSQSADASGDTETTVLVVDDHRSFAELLAAALDNVPGMTCVGTASSAAEGIGRAADLRPTIVVMDIQMPGQDGLAATRRIREVAPDSVIAVVTAHSDPQWISRAAQAGASAFIPKDGSLKEMIDILRRIGPGQMLVASSTFKGPPTRSAVPPTQDVPALTQRELDVLRYLGKGLPAKGIADVLGITLHTCRGYLKSLHNKLGVRSQLEAVIKAQNLGLIGAPDE